MAELAPIQRSAGGSVTVRHVPRRAIVYEHSSGTEGIRLHAKRPKGIGLQERVSRKVLASRAGVLSSLSFTDLHII